MFEFGADRNAWLLSLLRPLVRFCVRQALPIQSLMEVVKRLYVEAAAQELVNRGDQVTVSRISVMTGVHRKETNRLLGSQTEFKDTAGLKTKVIGQWVGDSRFHDESGKPRALSYRGTDSEFKKLVSLCSNDFNPATVLFELERVGAVERTSDGIVLKTEAYQTHSNIDEGFASLGRDIEALVSGVEHNLLERPPVPNLHAKTEFDNIYREDIPMITEWLLKEGSLFHKKVREFLSQFDKDINPNINKSGGTKIVVGAFSAIEEPPTKE